MDPVRLAYMVDQIARNFATQGDDAAIAATARHITLYWDPRMKAAIIAHDRAGLSPVGRAAVEALVANRPD